MNPYQSPSVYDTQLRPTGIAMLPVLIWRRLMIRLAERSVD
jgi:hypothetical protein